MDFSDLTGDNFEDEADLDPIDQVFNLLVRHGALELVGIDPDTEEPLYAITQECKRILPKLYEDMRSQMNEVVFDLWNLGIIDFSMGENDEEDMVRIAEDGPELFLKHRNELSSTHVNFFMRLYDEGVEFTRVEDEL